MNRPRLFLLTLAISMLLVGSLAPAWGYPEPARVSPSWSIDFEWQTPRAIAIEDVDGSTRWFWYMSYKVTNNTGSDRLFIPDFTIATDTGRIITAGLNVPASLFPKIKQELRNDLLESPVQVVGQLLQGEDFARESVAIWPAFEADARQMSIFVSGLSGETAEILHPLTGEPELLRRTHMLRFGLPGAPPTPQRQSVVLREQIEVMR